MYFVYRFLDINKNVIYVGKSKQDLEIRFAAHSHLPSECYALVSTIEFIVCKTESDMSIKEIFYINKYQTNKHYFYNILDTTELPTSVTFDDNWSVYKGPLPPQFSNSVNYKEGYASQRETKYNKDGTINKSKTNKQKGVSSYVDALTRAEVDIVIEHLIHEINCATNQNQEQMRFRNLLMFVCGVNFPLKPSEFLSFKYRDLFDENDNPKDYEYKLGRYQQDEVVFIPLKKVVSKVLVAYTKKYGLSYKNNSEDVLFESRKHQPVDLKSWWRILSDTTSAAGVKKNIGAESLRKTYGLNIYHLADDKIEALLFLGELWGQVREAKIIRYLGLASDGFDFSYYLGEKFSLGNVDLSKINCLKT